MAGANAIQLEKQSPTAKQNQEDPSKFYYHFLYKVVIVAIFLVILPLFPSQAPEFINHSLLTRSWELLHLLFVGIAITYGLFSRPNDETEKENSSKLENAHLVVSRFLQVSSLFEDEAETPSDSDETNVQTWSIQYRRKKPTVVLAPQHSNFEQQSATSSRIGEKPLLLPVRSLKSRVPDPGDDKSASANVSSATSKSGSKRFSTNANKARDGEVEGCDSPKVEDKMNENVVLPSPIPWRSSLMDQESELCKLESRSMKSQKSHSSRPSSVSSSSKELSPSASFSSESLAKNAEDLMRKKGFYKSSPPPPPPPPPPPIFQIQKSISMKPRSSSFNKGGSFDKELKRSFTSERNDLKGPNGLVENFSMGKSVRTIRAEAFRRRGETEEEEEGTNARVEKSTLEAEQHFIELGSASAPLVSVEVSEEEKESFLDKVIVESDEDTETEDEEVGKRLVKESGNGDEGPDVDKKADEFIAKFREQIRLQRIYSIKRSAPVTTKNSFR